MLWLIQFEEKISGETECISPFREHGRAGERPFSGVTVSFCDDAVRAFRSPLDAHALRELVEHAIGEH